MSAPYRVLPSPAERRLAARLSGIDDDITTLYEQLRTAQLGATTITGTMPIRDADGILTGIVGVQSDGTTGITYQNASPPPRPNTADLAAFPAGLGVAWNGEFATADRPANFRNVEVYLVTNPAAVLGPSNFVGTLSEAGAIPCAPLPYVPHYAYLIATNLAEPAASVGSGPRGTASAVSLVSAGVTPAQVVADAVLAGVVNALALADGAVTRAKVATAAIDGTKVEPASITSPLIAANTILGSNIAAQTISGDLVATDTLDARTIGALSIAADALQANSVSAGALAAGSVTASKLETDLLLASRIVAGTLTGNRVEIHPVLGIQAFFGNTQTVWIDASTGNLTATGTFRTALSGQRIELNPGGANADAMRFWPSSGAQYASIDAFTSGSAAGIMMYGLPTAGVNRGIVVARDTYASIVYGNPANLTALSTDIFAAPGGARVRAYQTDMMCDQDQGADPGVRFMMTNGTTPRSGTLMYYNNTGFDEAHFAATNKDVGISFASGKVYIVGNTVTVRRDFQCNNLIYDGTLTNSGRAYKRNIVAAADLDVRQGVKYARAVRFQRNYLDEPAVYDAEGGLIRAAQEAPVQLGLMADELPAQCVTTIPNFTPGAGDTSPAIDNQALLSMCWQGLGEVWDVLDARFTNPVPIAEVAVDPQPPVSGCLVYAAAGTLYALFASGKRVKIA